MNFRSKIDAWLIVALIASAAPPVVAAISAHRAGQPWLLHIAIAASLLAIYSWLLGSTRYTVTGDQVLIRSGPFTWQIPIKDITQVVESRSPVSSPALSLDRLRIEYGQGKKSILVSPADKVAFIQAIGIRGAA